jgi:tetratricopeptide (TPR) repeat protein
MSADASREELSRAAQRLLGSSRMTLADAAHALGERTGNARLLMLAERLGRQAVYGRILDLLERALRGADLSNLSLYEEAVSWRAMCLYEVGRYHECIERLRDHYGDDQLGSLGSEHAFWSLYRLGRKEEALEGIDRALKGRLGCEEDLLPLRIRILREEGRELEAMGDERALQQRREKGPYGCLAVVVAILVVSGVLIEWLAAATPWLLMTLRGVLVAIVIAIPLAMVLVRRSEARRLRRFERSRSVQSLPPMEREALLRELSPWSSQDPARLPSQRARTLAPGNAARIDGPPVDSERGSKS